MTHLNYVSGHNYSGHNVAELEEWRSTNEWPTGLWITFLQAKQLGINILKGSKSTSVFRGFSEVTEQGKTKSVPLGYARVFNMAQTDAPAEMIEHDMKVLEGVK